MLSSLIAYFNFLIGTDKRFVRQLRRILGFYPSRIEYYKIAILHRSASLAKKNGIVINNERLEYLGDAILDAIVSDYLYHKFPDKNEGFLTQMRSRIVNGKMLYELARRTNFSKLIITNTRTDTNNKHLYGDGFEALIGAIYLDKGYKQTFDFLINNIIENYILSLELENANDNFKSRVIEWGQKHKKEIVFYTDLETPVSKYFISYIRINGETIGSGIGISKKEAEQKAAKVALEKLDK